MPWSVQLSQAPFSNDFHTATTLPKMAVSLSHRTLLRSSLIPKAMMRPEIEGVSSFRAGLQWS